MCNYGSNLAKVEFLIDLEIKKDATVVGALYLLQFPNI